MLHSRFHHAPDGILPVEESGIIKTDEKLAVGAIGVLRPRHRADAADMRLGIEFLRQVRLVRTAHPCPLRTAALSHEAIDDPVEFQAVVEPLAHQFLDPRHMARGKVGSQFDHYIAAIDGEREGFIGHENSSFFQMLVFGPPP